MKSDLQKVIDEANALHVRGFNCSESVFGALTGHWGMDLPFSVATGLGGGISRTGETCGALLGAILAIGARFGRKDPKDEEGKVECYKMGREAAEAFATEMGTCLCREILGFVLSEEGARDKYKAGGFQQGKCQDAITVAVRAGIEAFE